MDLILCVKGDLVWGKTLVWLKYLSIILISLFCLHGFLCLIRLLHFNQGGAGHTEDTVDVHSHLDFHLGALPRGLWDNLLDHELTCKEEKKEISITTA